MECAVNHGIRICKPECDITRSAGISDNINCSQVPIEVMREFGRQSCKRCIVMVKFCHKFDIHNSPKNLEAFAPRKEKKRTRCSAIKVYVNGITKIAIM